MKKKQRGGEEWTLPTPRHTHTPCTRSLYRRGTRYDNKGMHKVWQVCYRATKKKPGRKERYENPLPATPAHPPHLTSPLYRGNTQGTTERYVIEDATEKRKGNKA